MLSRALPVAVALVLAASSCSGGGGAAQPTGHSCTKASDCYSGLDAGALSGQVVCLGLQGGYCSHTCTMESDCCAISGECPGGIKQVCAPLQASAQTYCFVSCEAADITPSGDGGSDPNAFCKTAASSTFTCRSTGGGVNNRKFCGP
jgi:hypothetical protein